MRSGLRRVFEMALWVVLLLLPGQALLAERAAAKPARGTSPAADPDPGLLVVAPDRGFLGNEEIRDAFEAFAGGRNAALVVVTDERTRENLDRAMEAVVAAGARRVVVLPLFLSRSDPRLQRVESLLAAAAPPLTWSRTYGESYLAAESLADRLRAVANAEGRRVIVVGDTASDADRRRQMTADWQRLAEAAAQGLGFESTRVVVESSPADVGRSLAEAAKDGPRPVIVPFHLGRKPDGMMSFTASLRRHVPEGAELAEGDLTPHDTVQQWLTREANRHVRVRPEDVGVAVLAHGADYHWNETMREAVASLATRYKVEPAFSMADAQVIERAVRRLERRGARHIVVLRVFGLADSFRADVERLIGVDIERGDPLDAHAGHGDAHGHGTARPAPRIRSSAVVTTTGGLEDHPLFAEALLERTRALSRDPARETVILVAHGSGDDTTDAHWQKILDSLAARMRSNGGSRFRAIHAATWREDWPDKRKPAVERVRALVEAASRDGGRVLVVPARTLGQGPEKRLLDGLAFDLGEGFAPHPLFGRWAEEQVKAALVEAGAASGAPPAARTSDRSNSPR